MLPLYRSLITRTRALSVLICIIMAHSIAGDSLWDPEAPGLLSGSGDLKVGDTVLVRIDSTTELKYSSSRLDSERLSIELTGGEGAGLFSFLPGGGSSGNQTLSGTESVSAVASLAVRIVDIDDNEHLILRGGRTISIQGKEESIFLTGTADPMMVGEDRTLPFSHIADVSLTFTTMLEPGNDAISADDIVRTTPEAGETSGTSPGEITLSDEKRNELMLIYINRLVDLIFE